jgi:hypothetical protein
LAHGQVFVDTATGAQAPRLKVSTVTPSGAATATTVVEGSQIRFVVPGAPSATELVISNPTKAPVVVGAVAIITSAPGQRLLLDGALQGMITPPHWRPAGQIGPFLAFKNTATLGVGWLQATSSTSPNTYQHLRGRILVENTAASAPSVWIVTTSTEARLVRSETYSPGWTARLTPVGGGPTRVLNVEPFGLVQAVTIPKGSFVVTWRYAPVSLLAGLVLTIVGLVVFVALLLDAFVEERRRRRSSSPD